MKGDKAMNEREYNHHFKNGLEACLRISNDAMSVTWSDDNKLDYMRKYGSRKEIDAFVEEYRKFRDASLLDFGNQTKQKILVVEK